MDNFDELWTEVTKWGEGQAELISTAGRRLTAPEISVARKVGVKEPESIRILIVESVPFPTPPGIRIVALEQGFDPDQMGGMTLGRGIFIRRDQEMRAEIWRHEFRHVAQYECFGSIGSFMFFYLKELLHFRYGSGPLEIDAAAAENAP
jgi:hypothetical protein